MSGHNTKKGLDAADWASLTDGLTPSELGDQVKNAVTSLEITSIVMLTQAQYDALTPADDVMYVIVE